MDVGGWCCLTRRLIPFLMNKAAKLEVSGSRKDADRDQWCSILKLEQHMIWQEKNVGSMSGEWCLSPHPQTVWLGSGVCRIEPDCTFKRNACVIVCVTAAELIQSVYSRILTRSGHPQLSSWWTQGFRVFCSTYSAQTDPRRSRADVQLNTCSLVDIFLGQSVWAPSKLRPTNKLSALDMSRFHRLSGLENPDRVIRWLP